MNPKTKKYLKLSGFGVMTLGLAGLIVGVSTSWNGLKIISAGGSSAILPLINSLSNLYDRSDVVATAGGSGAGISAILSNTKEIGMASKNPEMELSPEWKEVRAKTITVAWDGIAIVYKTKENNNNNNVPINIDETNITKIYEAFSGLREYKFSDFGIEKDLTPIVPYARNGGATTSGTADAFLKNSNLNFSELNPLVREILETGSYKGNVQQTAESNSQTWKRVKDAGIGAMTYLSTGFILNNYNEIISNGFQIATYKGFDLINKNNSLVHNNNIAKGYNWFRPFNLIVSLNKINESTKEFIKWIFKNSENVEKFGYVPLSLEQIKSMIKDPQIDPQTQNLIMDGLFIDDDATLQHCGAKVSVQGNRNT